MLYHWSKATANERKLNNLINVDNNGNYNVKFNTLDTGTSETYKIQQIGILGLSAIRWKGNGKRKLNKKTLPFCAPKKQMKKKGTQAELHLG